MNALHCTRAAICLSVLVLAGFSRADDQKALEQELLGTVQQLIEFKELAEMKAKVESLADLERQVRVPMRDGVNLATDVYLPRDADGPVPTIFWRTPYNFNKLGLYQGRFIVAAMENGYAFVMQNERGKFYSEGDWKILGHPRTDGYDALTWIAEQPWSNGKVGTIGCSSSAEWQLALAATDHPAHAAMVPMASGAGIGKVPGYQEHGNWYRGGVFQMLFGVWLHYVQNTQRPTFPYETSQEDLARLMTYFDLAPDMPYVDWSKEILHLPLAELLSNVNGPKGTFAEFIRRTPDSPEWYEGGLYHANEPFEVPSLWINSWYDVSIGPNMALFNHVTANARDPEVARNQYVVVAPSQHCAFFDASEKTIVGERDMGDTRFDYSALILSFFDRWLKGEDNGFEKDTPRVRFYTMGSNQWQTADSWPPAGTETVTWYLHSGGSANSLFGDGKLSRNADDSDGAGADHFSSDPGVPVPSLGGGVCCIGGAADPGSFDQRPIEARNDVLVYTSEPLEEGLEISGPVEVTLYVSSDARDTDFTVKLIDVLPDGTAYNLDDTIQRARYREGYEKQVFMEDGRVYRLPFSAMTTSNYFAPGHRIRLEIAGSNFPRFARNMNTGGSNYDEADGVVARNGVHHTPEYPSQIRLPVVRH